jgi:hypothetical protein
MMMRALKRLPVAAASKRLLPVAAPIPGGSRVHRLLHAARGLDENHDSSSSSSSSENYMMDAALMGNEMATDPALLAQLVDILSSDSEDGHAAASAQEPVAAAAKGRSGYHSFCLNCCSPMVISFCEVGAQPVLRHGL